jgi:hypothetical protein
MMKKFAIASMTAAVSAAAGLVTAAAAVAAPSGPASAADALGSLQARGYDVIVNHVGTGSLDQCTMYAVRPGSTYTRMDSGFPGAGNDVITKVVSMTVYLDTAC